MRFLASAGALALVAASWGTAAAALTLAQAASPAERPPSGYSKDVYVDSRGCVYVRASIGSTVNWVPRLTRDRKTVVCGMTPTGAVASLTTAPPPPPAPPPPAAVLPATATAAASVPEPAMLAAPMQFAAPAPVATGAAPVTRTMEVSCPADGTTAHVTIGGDTVQVTCPAGMTRATSYIVTHADGSRSRLVTSPAPIHAAATGRVLASGRVVIGGLPPGAPDTAFGNGYGITTSAGPMDPVPGATYAVAPSTVPVQIPAGYRAAWDDDRLNPYRGPRTGYGDAQMSAVLDTAKVPMQPARTTAVRTVAVSKNQAVAPVPAAPAVAPGARFVQVGAFRQDGNARNALARIRGLGLGSATAQTGSGLTLVMAGPFASTAELQRALATLRGYFPDAYPRS